MNRRHFAKGVFSAALVTAVAEKVQASGAIEADWAKESPINVMLAKSYRPPVSDLEASYYPARLARATLDFFEKSYGGKRVPIWHRQFEEIDFEKRVENIIYWLMKGVKLYQHIHPVDPSWVIAQMMHESYFCESAVSRALAVGIFQFVNATARVFKY